MLIVVELHETSHVRVDRGRHRNLELLVGGPVGCREALHLEFKFLILEGVSLFKAFDFILSNHQVSNHTFEQLDLGEAARNLEVGDHLLLCFDVFGPLLEESARQMVPVNLNIKVLIVDKVE